MCNILHKYVKEESEFIMEVLKVKGFIPDILHLCTEIQPYRSVYTARKQSCNYFQFIEDLNEVVHSSEELLHNLYNLQRKTASQLLTFTVTDTDREYNKKYPNHMPIAYALVGNSLSMDKFRNMLDQVSNVCQSKGVDILCQCCNGQFWPIVCKTKYSEPLTWIAWQKDLWNTSMKMSKRDLIKSLEYVSKVDDEMLLNLGSENVADEFTYTFQNLTFQKHKQDGITKLEMHSNGGPLHNYETAFWHCIYTTKRWKHRSYDPVWDYSQVQCNNTSPKSNEVTSS